VFQNKIKGIELEHSILKVYKLVYKRFLGETLMGISREGKGRGSTVIGSSG
jgi:hypothetical protein